MPLSGIGSASCGSNGLVVVALAGGTDLSSIRVHLYDYPPMRAFTSAIRCVQVACLVDLDEIDQQIVALLRENARRSFQDIGSRVSL